MPLTGLAARLLPGHAHVGIASARNGEPAQGSFASAAGLPVLTADSLIRVASLSKIVTAQVCAAQGLATRVTAGQGREVPLAALLSHTSGLRDDSGYAVPDGGKLADLLDRAVWGDPGFAYANLGYLLAADATFGAGFGVATAAWLQAHGIPGGFNWHAVPSDLRQTAVPCYRATSAAFEAQIDAPIPHAGPATMDAAAFSPQGGLRTSLAGCLTLAQAIPRLDTRILHDPGPPQPTELWDQYGIGLMILRRPAFYPRPLIGHFANAYGLCGGAWWDTEANLAFAYLINGLPMGDDSDDLRPAERAIFDAMAALD